MISGAAQTASFSWLDMSTPKPMPGKLPPRPAYTDYGVRLQPIRNPIWRFILYALPWAILIALVVEILSFTDWMFFTGQLAAALALFAFQMLMRQIPVVLDALWSRNLIALKQNQKPDPSVGQAEASAVTTDLQALTRSYADFLTVVEYSLNHPGSLILGFVFAGLGIARFPYEAGGLGVFLQRLPQRPPTYLGELLFEGFIGFILGMMAWRMIFTALQVSELDNRFDLRVRFDHPDRAGGLEPLGNLCLWNALILTIPGIFLGGWLIVWPRFPDYIYPNTGVFVYGDLFYRLLLVPIVLAPIVFILPLWSVHSLMARKAVVVRRDLDHFGERIDDLGRTLLNRADDLDP
jgi:hypothetical protein